MMKIRKLPKVVDAKIASFPHRIDTLHGKVFVNEGDLIVRDGDDVWPLAVRRALETYEPADEEAAAWFAKARKEAESGI